MKVIGLIATLMLSSIAHSHQEIQAWTYYDFAPFSVDNQAGSGLTYDLVTYLNEKLEPKEIEFKVEYLPRPRLNEKLLQGESGMVVWPIPLWFGDLDQTKYIWTNPILNDQNDVLSHTNKPIEYDGPESLIGYKFGGVFGHKFSGIQPLCDDGTLNCEYVYQEKLNLMKLIGQRVDATVMASTARSYIFKDSSDSQSIHVSAKPHSEYLRRLMLTQDLSDLTPALNEIIDQMRSDAEWHRILASYGIQNH